MMKLWFIFPLMLISVSAAASEEHDFAVLCQNPQTKVNNGRLIDPGLLTGVTPKDGVTIGNATWLHVDVATAAKVCAVTGDVLPDGIAVVMVVPHNENVDEPDPVEK